MNTTKLFSQDLLETKRSELSFDVSRYFLLDDCDAVNNKDQEVDKSNKKIPLTIVPAEITLSLEISPQAKLVYFCLCSFKPSFPSYDKIQKVCGISRATVSKKLKELSNLGLIKVASEGLGKKNYYLIVNGQRNDVQDEKLAKRLPEGLKTQVNWQRVKELSGTTTAPLVNWHRNKKTANRIIDTGPVHLEPVHQQHSNIFKSYKNKREGGGSRGRLFGTKTTEPSLFFHKVIQELDFDESLSDKLKHIPEGIQRSWVKKYSISFIKEELLKAISIGDRKGRTYATFFTAWLARGDAYKKTKEKRQRPEAGISKVYYQMSEREVVALKGISQKQHSSNTKAFSGILNSFIKSIPENLSASSMCGRSPCFVV